MELGWDVEPWKFVSTLDSLTGEAAPEEAAWPGGPDTSGIPGKQWQMSTVGWSARQRLKLRHPIQGTGAKQKLILKSIL